MARAIADISDIDKYKSHVNEGKDTVDVVLSKETVLIKAKSDVETEISEYEQAQRDSEQLLSDANNKLNVLNIKKKGLETEIIALKARIASIYAEIAACVAELPENPAVIAEIHSLKEELHECKEAKKTAEEELERTKENIEKCEKLIQDTENLIQLIRNNLIALNEKKDQLINETRKIIDDSRNQKAKLQLAEELLAKSINELKVYKEIQINNVQNVRSTTFKSCTNLQYAGKTYDFDTETNRQNPERMKQLQEKYPDIKFSEVNEYGNTYPDLSKYEVYSKKFPPVTKENYENGTCLIGDSKSGSADFKKFIAAMEEDGYSREEIQKLLMTHTIHHDEDGVTLRLIPKDLHDRTIGGVAHNGGAEVIRLKIAML